MGFENFQEWALHYFCVQPVPLFATVWHPHCERGFSSTEVFPVFEFVASVFCAISQCHWEGFGSFFFLHPWFFYTLSRFPMSFLFFGLISHSSHSLYSYVSFPKVSDIFMALCWTNSNLSLSVVLRSSEMSTELQICLTSPEQKEGITSLNLLATLCAFQPRMLLTSFAVRVGYWHMFSLVFMRTPWYLSAQLLSSCQPHLAVVLRVISH